MYSRHRSPYLSEYKGLKSKQFLEELSGDKFATVRPTQHNVDKTILSWDKYGPKDATYRENLASFIPFAEEFFKAEYGSLFRNSIATDEEIMESYDLTKSPGFPATQFGVRSKEQYFNKPISDQMDALRHILPVIYNGVPKVEVKDMQDILAAKIRLFCVSPTHYLKYQKKFTLRLSERFKQYKWSAYGINLYSGGADVMCKELLRKWGRFCYDVSGWDKFIPLIPTIYKIHKELLEADGLYCDYSQDFDWVVNNLIEMLIRLPNGEVLRKCLGNPSGSGSTTLDNIRMHIFLFTILLAKAYYEKNDCYPSLALISRQLAYIFGDDIIAGIDVEFSLFIDRSWLKKHMQMFNLELKFLYINTTHYGDERDFLDDDTGEPLSFLGATFKIRRGMFIPCYDPCRLAHSCYYDLKKIELVGYLSKIMTLTVMSYGSGYFPQFLAFFKDYCLIPEVSKSDMPEIVSLRHIAHVMDEDFVHEFYAGFEGTGNNIADFFITDTSFFDQPEEDDIILQAKEAEDLNLFLNSKSMANNGHVLQRLIENKVLSPHSVAALKVAMDGWHDTTIADFRGIPDKHVGRLFTFDDVAETEISRSTAPGPPITGTWGCRVSALPIGNTISTSTAVLTGTLGNYTPSVTGAIGNVNIHYKADADANFPDVCVPGVSYEKQVLQMSNEFLTSKLKLCGLAIEVVNTTPTLTAGGLVTACNVPQPSSKSTFTCQLRGNGLPAGAIPASVSCRMINCPPKNLKEIARFSPFQGDAKNGIYINARMQFQDETPECMPVCPMQMDSDFQSPPPGGYVADKNVYHGVMDSPAFDANMKGFRTVINWFDMDTPVIMFTGLSAETTLMVRVRWFGQIVPDEDQNIFLRAAHPAPIYDPAFFEIYSRAMELIPQACYFTENPSGEWWKTALAGIAKAAAPLLMMIPHPIGKAAGVAAGGLGAVLDSQGQESKQKRKAKNSGGFYGQNVKKTKQGKFKNTQTGQKVSKKAIQRQQKGRVPNARPGFGPD